jgi:hypothetical protein
VIAVALGRGLIDSLTQGSVVQEFNVLDG